MPLDDAIALEARQEEGRWFPLPTRTGGEFYGVYTTAVSDQYRRRIDRKMEAWRRETGNTAKNKNGGYKDIIPNKVMGQILAASMAGCTVTKIRGVEFEGAELESTPSNIRLMLSVRENRDHCQNLLGDPEAFEQADKDYDVASVEDAAGNSSSGSTTTSAGPVSLSATGS